MFSINTNIASLQAQNYLRQTENFQNETINQVTSGLRIVNSGDDAAGLAIANTDRSNEAVLTQGIQNANDGLSQLQIADGGISNISQLLDRARTLATQSASGAFTGDRSVLNSEFQSVIQEVNRQAQAIGLNQGGTFATDLQVFVGGGRASGNVSSATNGTVSVNLSTVHRRRQEPRPRRVCKRPARPGPTSATAAPPACRRFSRTAATRLPSATTPRTSTSPALASPALREATS